MNNQTPNLLKGEFYPSHLRAACPRFHACRLTRKCQSYDPTQADCRVCELRVRPATEVGGVKAEGMYLPDLQDAMRTIEETLKIPSAPKDGEPTRGETGKEISEKWDRTRKAADLFRFWKFTTKTQLHDDVHAHIEREGTQTDVLGRLE